jgi:hypothetical protein
VPVSRNADRRRARMIRASRMTSMTVSSTPVRSHQRIRPPRASRLPPRSPDLLDGAAEELRTTRFRRCDRILMAGSSGEDSATCICKCTSGGYVHRRPRPAIKSRAAASLTVCTRPLRIPHTPVILRQPADITT